MSREQGGVCSVLRKHVAIIKLARPRPDETVYPEDFLKGAGESLALMFGVSWVVTLISNPEILDSNGLKDRLGYNTVCVGWDTTPATYFAQVLWAITAYLCLRYAWLDLLRTMIVWERLSTRKVVFSIVADVLYALSVCLFSLVFVMLPESSEFHLWGHTIAFVQYIIFRYIVILANVFEHAGVQTATVAFMVLSGFLSVAFPVCIFVDFGVYQQEGRTGYDPVIPAALTAVLDYSWFVCLPLTTMFVPAAEALHVHVDAVALLNKSSEEEEEEAEEEEEDSEDV